MRGDNPMGIKNPEFISITLNPVLDITGEVDKIIPNEKNYIDCEKRYPGGNGINVARILTRLGSNVVATGFLGGGVGEELFELLKREKLNTDFVSIKDNTRIGITVSSNDTNQQTRLSFSGPIILKSEFDEFKAKVLNISGKGLIVLGGSFPKQFELERAVELIKQLAGNGHPCIIDVPGKYLKDMVRSAPLMIKPNLIEFQALVGQKVKTIAEVVAAASAIKKYVELICISSVEGGALLIGKNEVWFGQIPSVEVRTTVGAGDSMVGAMAYKIKEYLDQSVPVDIKETLRWGLASACATLVTTGVELGEENKILEYLPMIKLKKIN